MAKQYLVESFCGPRAKFAEVTEVPKYAPLVESFKSRKKKLTESTVQGVQKILNESKLDKNIAVKVMTNLKEQGLKSDIRLWQFPVSRINDHDHPNLNGRVYGKKLWENVVNKQREIWQGGTGLANHPDDDEDGDFMKQSIVWLDGFIGDDGFVYGVGTFVGDGGQLAQQIIDVGGRVGFSTSGYGDFLADGIEVDPDNYEIDRFADMVLGPSQGVYGNIQDSFSNTIIEDTEGKNMKKSELTENKKKKSLLEDENVDTGSEGTESADMGSEDSGEGTGAEGSGESTEETEDTGTEEGGDEGESLSEQLLVSHYNDAIKAIGKKSNKLWEEKIHELETLVGKLKKESLSKKSKATLNETIQKAINAIMEDTSKAIQQGYEVRELCQELQINSLSKLRGIQEKIEDFTALEECLAKTTKESNKYKTLYEEKVQSMSQEAKESFNTEKSLKETQNKVDSLKSALKERKVENSELKMKLSKLKSSNIYSLKDNKDLKESLNEPEQKLVSYKVKVSKLRETVEDVQNQLKKEVQIKKNLMAKVEALRNSKAKLKDLLEESEKTINALSRKNEAVQKLASERRNQLSENVKAKRLAERKDRMHIHGIDGSVVKGENLFRESDEINSFLDQIDAPIETKNSLKGAKTLREAQNRYLFTNELLSEEEEMKRSKINNNRGPSPMSLSEMFQ